MKTRVEKQMILNSLLAVVKSVGINSVATNISWSLQKCGCKIIYCFTQFHEIELDETMLLK